MTDFLRQQKMKLSVYLFKVFPSIFIFENRLGLYYISAPESDFKNIVDFHY